MLKGVPFPCHHHLFFEHPHVKLFWRGLRPPCRFGKTWRIAEVMAAIDNKNRAIRTWRRPPYHVCVRKALQHLLGYVSYFLQTRIFERKSYASFAIWPLLFQGRMNWNIATLNVVNYLINELIERMEWQKWLIHESRFIQNGRGESMYLN